VVFPVFHRLVKSETIPAARYPYQTHCVPVTTAARASSVV
jgi:hypothetical protein